MIVPNSMSVPLIAEAFPTKHFTQMIRIWRNGGAEEVVPPFLPYMFVHPDLRNDKTITGTVAKMEPSTVRLLSDPSKDVQAIKCICRTTRVVGSINYKLQPLDGTRLWENHILFEQRIRLDNPAFFQRFPQQKPIKVLTFDLEAETQNGMAQNRIIAFARSINGETPICTVVTDLTDECEADLIRRIIDTVKTEDPDIISGYNIKGYDLPLILSRAKELNIETSPLTRNGTRPYIREDEKKRKLLFFPGRIILDLWEKVDKDQQIEGVKNTRLTTVCRDFFKQKVEEKIDVRNTAQYILTQEGRKQLADTNKQDVALCQFLWDVYFPTVLEIAEYMRIPLQDAVDITPTDVTTFLQGEGLAARHIISDGANHDRFRRFYYKTNNAEEQRVDDAYQGAIVSIERTGYFQHLYKIDFSGMYSAMAITFNLSPETVRLKKETPFRNWGPIDANTVLDLKRVGSTAHVTIFDQSLHSVIEMEIDLSETGILPQKLIEIRKMRVGLKKAYKEETDEKKKQILRSRQGAYKLLLNLPYGANANEWCRYGSLPVSMCIAAFARFMINQLLDFLRKKLGKKCIIEVDTDGVYITTKPDIKEVKQHLDSVCESLGIKNYSELDVEEYVYGVFLKMKNYFVVEPGGRRVIHGVSLKGQHRPEMWDTMMETIIQKAKYIFTHKFPRQRERIIRKLKNLKRYKLKDFTLRTTLKQAYYKNPNDLRMQLLRQWKEAYGMDAAVGTQFEYVKTPSGYMLAQSIKDLSQLDGKYYQEMLEKMLTSFLKSEDRGAQTSLTQFG